MRSQEGILRLQSCDIRNTNIESVFDLDHFMFVLGAEGEFDIVIALLLITLAETCHVERLMPMRFIDFNLRTDCLIDNLIMFVLFDVKLVSVDLHF